jgi:hypothetical protein
MEIFLPQHQHYIERYTKKAMNKLNVCYIHNIYVIIARTSHQVHDFVTIVHH